MRAKKIIANVLKGEMRYSWDELLNGIAEKGITVVTCTRRPEAMDNVFSNYKRQEQKVKELIIVLHSSTMDKKRWSEAARKYENVKVLQLDEGKTLGECLNFGAEHASYEFIAKFDDDDYYGPKYLKDAVKVFKEVEADVIGKSTSYVYFEKEKILALRNPGRENCYVNHIDGPTIIFRKSVLSKVKFRNITLGEDNQFCKDCVEQGLKIYSANRFQHVYMRHADIKEHTWTIENRKLLKTLKIISEGEIDYKKYINIEA